MIAELGQVALLGAVLISILMGVLPMIGAARGNQQLMNVGRTAATAQFLLVGSAFAMLTWAFIAQDFSVEYVARNSNSQLPMEYRFSAVWGSHEGSLLLWEMILCLWTFAVALFSKGLPDDFRARVLAVLGWVSFGFLLFIIFTSNPFGRLLPPAADGLDLNPLLQDPGLIIHPPMLYMGYVGFSVSFAFAVAALMGARHRPGQLVGLLRTGLGWLVVLGPGGECFLHALAGGHGTDSFTGSHRKTRNLPQLDPDTGHQCIFLMPAGDLPGALRRADLGSCICL